MITIENVHAYSEFPQPLLTAYLDTNPAKASNRRPVPAYRTWLNAEAKIVAGALPIAERKLFLEQLERVENFLRDSAAREHGLIIFAGSSVWEVVPMQQDITNELHWGAPSVAQLLWMLDEHRPYCVVVVDRAEARFFRFDVSQITQIGHKSLEVDISEWKKQDMGKFAGPREGSLRGAPRMKKSRGSQRDTFQHRVEAQYEHSFVETAEQAAQLAEVGNLSAVFLVGSERLIEPIARSFPPGLPRPVVKIKKDLGGMERDQLERSLAPLISQWERTHQSEMVSALLNGARGTIVGMDETLARLQRGGIRTLVVARELRATLRRCVRCGWADRSADAVCSACGGERQFVALRELLPELAWKHNTEVQIVSGEAADRLAGAEGMGGWLRQPDEALAAKAFKRAS